MKIYASDLILPVYVIFVIFVVSLVASQYFSGEDEMIESSVVDVDISNEEYMVISFDNGESYNVAYGDENLDFTVNSELIVYLHFDETWLIPNTDKIWGVKQIIKVPGD